MHAGGQHWRYFSFEYAVLRSKFCAIFQAGGVDARAGGFGVRQLGVAASHTKIDPRVAQDLKVLMSQEIYRYFNLNT